MTTTDPPGRARSPRRTGWWVALGVAPIVVLAGVAWWQSRPIGYDDELARLDRNPCDDDGGSCAGGLLVDGRSWHTTCRLLDPDAVGEPLAQGPGGRGHAIAGVDPALAIAVTEASECVWLRDEPILLVRCFDHVDLPVEALSDAAACEP